MDRAADLVVNIDQNLRLPWVLKPAFRATKKGARQAKAAVPLFGKVKESTR